MSAVRTSVLAALALAAVLAPSAASAADPLAVCRKTLGKAGTVLTTSIFTAEQACLVRLGQGKLGAGQRCSEAGWSIANVTEPKTQAKLVAAIAKLRATIAKRCATTDLVSAPPTGLGLQSACAAVPGCDAIVVQDLATLTDCMECAHVTAAHALLAIQNADSTAAAPEPPAGGGTYYVSPAGSDGSGCGSQAAPCRTIQRAVNDAADDAAIHVAAGTYTYDAGLDPCAQYIETDAIVCVLNKKVTLRGGYPAGDWSAADPTNHPSTIDGANARRGVLVQRTSSSAPAAGITMEGFTITHGRVRGSASGGDAKTFAFGAGMLVDSSPVDLRALRFVDNQALGGDTTGAYGGAAAGGGLALRRVATGSTLQNLTFSGNLARGGSGDDRGGFGIGGGLFTFESTLTATDLVFTDNVASGGPTGGNGISGGERGDGQGGGAAIQLGSDVEMVRVVAHDNQATGGDAATYAGGAFGGGLYAEDATFVVREADVAGNVALAGDAVNGGVSSGGGLMTQNSDVTVDRSRLVDNTATGGNGSSVAGAGGGGGAYVARFGSNGSANFVNSIIADNLAEMGAVGSPPGGGGGGLFLQGLPTLIDHCTIADNRIGAVQMQGTGIVMINGTSGANATIRYSLIAGHTSPSGPAALHVQPSSSVTLVRGAFSGNGRNTNSDGNPGPAGSYTGLTNMLTLGPLQFVSPGAPSFDYHVGGSSPAIDQATGSGSTIDFDGQARPDTPDLGADEAG